MGRLTSRLSNRDKFLLSAAVAAAGAALFLYALISVFYLRDGAAEGKLVLAILTGALYALSIALLRREGCDAGTLMLALLPLGLGFYLRVICLDYVSVDYQQTLAPWIEFFRDNGGFAAIREPIGSYPTPILYLMAIFSMLPLPTLYLAKLCTVLFDLLLAWGGMRIVRVFRPQSRMPEAAFLALFLLPTVVLNGALWTQNESIFASLIFLSLASILENHPRRSLLFAALAFSFQPQAAYVLPVLVVVWFMLRIRLSHVLIFPLTCLAIALPALLMGKPVGDILGIAIRQMKEDFSSLSLNAPNLFALFPKSAGGHIAFTLLGILLALAAAAGILLLCFRLRRRLRDQELIPLALLFSLTFPFLLPHVHERYFFLACALAVVSACLEIRRLPLAALIQLAVLGGYYASLMGRTIFPMPLGTLMILISLFLLLSEYLPWDPASLLQRAGRSRRAVSAGAGTAVRKKSKKSEKNS